MQIRVYSTQAGLREVVAFCLLLLPELLVLDVALR